MKEEGRNVNEPDITTTDHGTLTHSSARKVSGRLRPCKYKISYKLDSLAGSVSARRHLCPLGQRWRYKSLATPSPAFLGLPGTTASVICAPTLSPYHYSGGFREPPVKASVTFKSAEATSTP